MRFRKGRAPRDVLGRLRAEAAGCRPLVLLLVVVASLLAAALCLACVFCTQDVRLVVAFAASAAGSVAVMVVGR